MKKTKKHSDEELASLLGSGLARRAAEAMIKRKKRMQARLGDIMGTGSSKKR